MLAIDHVILGVRDLDAATRRVEALGLGVVDGGRHVGLGTANRIVPLAGTPPQYLELLGVVDRAEANRQRFGQALMERIADGDRLVRWCLQTHDLDAVAARHGLVPEPRGRLRPDGAKLTWRAAGLAQSLERSWLPFFVAWDDPTHHPGLTPATHRTPAHGFSWIELATNDPARLANYLQGADVDVRAAGGAPALLRAAITTDAGELIIA